MHVCRQNVDFWVLFWTARIEVCCLCCIHRLLRNTVAASVKGIHPILHVFKTDVVRVLQPPANNMEIVLNYFTTNQFATVKQYFTNGSAAAVAAMVAAGADGVNTTFEPTSGPITPATTDQKCFYENTVYSINDTNFDYLNELFKQKFNDASVIISVVILILINFIVIAGNILVIVSVFVSTKLRTVTNFFIGNHRTPIQTLWLSTNCNFVFFSRSIVSCGRFPRRHRGPPLLTYIRGKNSKKSKNWNLPCWC